MKGGLVGARGDAFKTLKGLEPQRYYFEIIKFLAEKFPGVHLEYKLRKRTLRSEDYLEKAEEAFLGRFKRLLRKILKNIMRSILFWRYPSPGELFVRTSEQTHLKYIQAEFWQHDENLWVYFMYLNLAIVVTLYFGGY
jgi:hypothetical protein